ncbi:hypothetical protein BvCmsSIP038_01040 [Escherichia coli]|nr:hypothetical protein BvCmsSIP038_01040 [Escherichia coli]
MPIAPASGTPIFFASSSDEMRQRDLFAGHKFLNDAFFIHESPPVKNFRVS